MSGRFMVGIAEGAVRDFAEAGENTAQTISKKLITDVADTEESAVERTLAADAQQATKMSQILDGLNGEPGSAASALDGSASSDASAASSAASRGASGDPGGDFGDGDIGGQGSEGNGPTPACKDPIDPISGQMMNTKVDVELAGILPLILRRAYASGYRRGQLFGPGWSSTLDQRLIIDADGIHFLGDDAQTLNYPEPMQPGQQVLPPGAGARWPLTWDRRTDAIAITDPTTGLTRHFAPPTNATPNARAGSVNDDSDTEVRHLVRITDRNGNWLTIARDADGVPTYLDHVGGYRIAVDSSYRDRAAGFRVDGLRLLDPSHPDGVPLVRYGYDPAGRLVEIIDTNGVPLIYEYDDADRIVAWIDRGGFRYEYAYDDEQEGRIVRVGGEDGTLAATFEYDRETRCTKVIDSYQAVTEYWYDEHNHLTKLVDPLGNSTLTRHDRFGRLIEQTDPLGNTTRFVRDESGNIREIHRPDGSRVAAEYNDLQLQTRLTAASGTTSALEYDERGNLTASVDPLGAMIRYTYNEHGALTATTDPLGNTTVFAVNQAGLPTTITDPLGAAWNATRDAYGRVTRMTDPLGNATTTEYDVEGRLAARTSPDGARETWSYDSRGNLAQYTNAAGARTTFEFGSFRKLLARTDPDGSRYEFTHDRELRLTAVANPLQATWTYEYDALGGLIAEQDFNGRHLSYEYDAAGRVIRRVNGAGEAVDLTRDVHGRVIEQRPTDQPAITFEYDLDGALVRATNPDAELEFARDATGQIVAETVDGRTLSKTHDALGNRIERTTPSGRTSVWQYDAAGRPQSLTAGTQQISFGHDAAGRESFRWLGASTALTNEWDDVGRLTARRLLAVAGPEDARTSSLLQERTWTYRADGNPDSITDTASGTRNLTLDPLGRVTAVSAATWTEQYAFDALGNVTHAADSRSPDAASAGPRELSGTLLRRAGRVTYEYDAQGRLVRTIRRTLSGNRKIWTYTYDAFDRMVQAQNPDGQRWRYTYDPLGRRTAKQRLSEDDQVLEQTRFTWDAATLVEQEHSRVGDHGITTTSWDYEPGSWTPVAQDQRTYYTDAPQDVIDQQFHAIIADLVGTPTELVTPDGAIAWRRTTGLWGTALPPSSPSPAPTPDCPLRFPGQYHDPETGLDYNYRRYYDPDTARYATPDPLGLAPAPNHHGYVENPLTWADPLGLAGTPGASGGSSGDFEEFYRTMSKEHYEILKATGRLSPTSETFISPTQGFSEDYQGVLVKFQMQPGTRSKLEDIGVRDISAATGAEYPDMPSVGKGWTRDNAFFKGEGADHINIGLGKGKALNVFNDNIAGFDKIKEIGCDS